MALFATLGYGILGVCFLPAFMTVEQNQKFHNLQKLFKCQLFYGIVELESKDFKEDKE